VLNQVGIESHPDPWVGLVTLLPWVLLYLRGVLAELGKSSAQALWKTMARHRRKQQQSSAVTVVIVVSKGGDCNERE
jgi:hypothetical protein